jgi:hypothetical protein
LDVSFRSYAILKLTQYVIRPVVRFSHDYGDFRSKLEERGCVARKMAFSLTQSLGNGFQIPTSTLTKDCRID